MAQTRTKMLGGRVTEEELERIQAAAARRHLGVSGWVRMVVMEAAEKEMAGEGMIAERARLRNETEAILGKGGTGGAAGVRDRAARHPRVRRLLCSRHRKTRLKPGGQCYAACEAEWGPGEPEGW